jgi:TonB-linked SusC/RagA family outer membrane protein
VFPWLRVDNNFSYSQRSYFTPLSVRSPGTNILRRLTDEFNPLSFFQNPDGTLTKSAALTFGSFLTGGNFQKENWQELRNTIAFEAGFLGNALKINGNFSYIYSPYLMEEQATPVPYSEKPGEILIMDINQDYAGEVTNRESYIGANLYGSYERTFGSHFFKLLAGYNYENTNLIIRHFRRNQMINPGLPDPGLLTGSNIILTGGGNEWTTSGEFFRFNYNFREKYLIEANGRYDGSSKFPLGQQFGFFPSISVGWRISNESFWKVSPDIISNLKVRASYGSLGNGNVSPYQYLETMPVGTLGRVIGGIKPLYTNNPNVIPDGLTWEKSTTANLGIDAGLLRNRLSLTLDVYRRTTTGMFTQGVTLPGIFGAAVPKGNYADMRTPGWELSIAWRDQIEGTKPIRYGVSFHLSDNYSIVDRFNNPEGLIEQFYVGKRLGDIWGYKVNGFYLTDDELANAPDQTRVYVTSQFKNRLIVGDLKFEDLDHNGKIDPGALTLDNKGDLIIIGNSQPRYLFGFNGNVDWNNFNFSIFLQGIGRRDWWPGSETWQFWGQYNRPYTSMPLDVYNQIWSPENPNGYFPNLVGYEANNNNRTKAMNSPSTYFLQNAAYIRLKNLTLGYSLPQSLISKVKLNQARIFFTGQNLWVWSPMFRKIKTIDPEGIVSQNNSKSESNIYLMPDLQDNEGAVYPILKTFTVGVNISF